MFGTALAVLVGVLVVTPGRIDVQLFEAAREIPIWATCGAALKVDPASPFQRMTQDGPCGNQLTTFWSETFIEPGHYAVATADSCPGITSQCFGIEFQCEPVAVKQETWAGFKGLYKP